MDDVVVTGNEEGEGRKEYISVYRFISTEKITFKHIRTL